MIFFKSSRRRSDRERGFPRTEGRGPVIRRKSEFFLQPKRSLLPKQVQKECLDIYESYSILRSK